MQYCCSSRCRLSAMIRLSICIYMNCSLHCQPQPCSKTPMSRRCWNRRKQQRWPGQRRLTEEERAGQVQREKDKLAKQERKDKEKKRTQKGETQEIENFSGLYNTKIVYLQEKNTMRPQQTISRLTLYASISCFVSDIVYWMIILGLFSCFLGL